MAKKQLRQGIATPTHFLTTDGTTLESNVGYSTPTQAKVVQSDAIRNLESASQIEYDALETPDPDSVYVVVDAAHDKALYTSKHKGVQIDKSVSQFNENGFLLHEDSGRAYVDIDFPIIIRTTGGGRPELNALIGNITAPQWAIGNNLVCEGQELIHGWDEGSPVSWHLHMITGGTDTTDRYVNFQVEYTYATLGSQLAAADTQSSGNILIPANTPDRTHTIVPIHTFTPTEAKIGTQVYVRLDRIATTDAALSPTANPFVSMLQVHILVNTIGSRQLGIK